MHNYLINRRRIENHEHENRSNVVIWIFQQQSNNPKPEETLTSVT